jgi:hypothetical protein
MVTGCATFFGKGKSQGYSPEYCYDCHYQPRWEKAYKDCGYYIIRVKEAGYEYRMRSDSRAEFVTRSYDIKTARDRQQADYEYRQQIKKAH